MTKTTTDHIDLYRHWVSQHQITHTKKVEDRILRTIEDLVACTDRDGRRVKLHRLRDLYHPMYTVPAFASINEYEKWVNA